MYVQYKGEIEDEIITDILEKVLERHGIKKNKKKISRDIFLELEDFFMENYCAC